MGADIHPLASPAWDDVQAVAVPLPSMVEYRPIARIQATVALSYAIRVEHMKSPCRWRRVAWPRQVAMYLTRELTHHSLPMIGHHFGERDHTTVLHAIRAVQRRMVADPLYAADVTALRQALS
jgi:chromosomal replication initiator protein